MLSKGSRLDQLKKINERFRDPKGGVKHGSILNRGGVPVVLRAESG